jgi:hypothetical protein
MSPPLRVVFGSSLCSRAMVAKSPLHLDVALRVVGQAVVLRIDDDGGELDAARADVALAVGVVEVLDLLVARRIDLAPHAIQELLHGEPLAHHLAQALLGLPRLLERLLELLLAADLLLLAADDLRDLVVGRQQLLLVGALEEDFLLDQIVQDLEARGAEFERRERRLLPAGLLADHAIDLAQHDVLAVHRGGDVLRPAAGGAALAG